MSSYFIALIRVIPKNRFSIQIEKRESLKGEVIAEDEPLKRLDP